MKTKRMKLASLLSMPMRRKLWDLRDRLEAMETAALSQRHETARPVRFNKNKIRILEVQSHAYAR